MMRQEDHNFNLCRANKISRVTLPISWKLYHIYLEELMDDHGKRRDGEEKK
jgi:hypothetical protein